MNKPRASNRDQGVPLLVCVLILTVGLVVHASNGLPLADKLGDALSAALVVALLWLLGPGAPWGAGPSSWASSRRFPPRPLGSGCPPGWSSGPVSTPWTCLPTRWASGSR